MHAQGVAGALLRLQEHVGDAVIGSLTELPAVLQSLGQHLERRVYPGRRVGRPGARDSPQDAGVPISMSTGMSSG